MASRCRASSSTDQVVRSPTANSRELGGHPELVGEAGIAFDDPEEVADALDRVVAELDERRAAIRVTPMGEVADRYLEVLRG